MEKIGEINNLIKPVNPVGKKEKIEEEKPKESFEDILKKKQKEEDKK